MAACSCLLCVDTHALSVNLPQVARIQHKYALSNLRAVNNRPCIFQYPSQKLFFVLILC